MNAEQMLRAMDDAGIERSVLVQASTCYGHDNAYVADAVAAHRDRFAGVFSVDMLAPDAPAQVRRWKDRGLSGLRVFIAGHTTSQDARLDDPRSFPAWRSAVEAKLPVCVQCRAPHLPQLETLLEEFPAARIVLDHMARPDAAKPEPLLALARYKNLYLKFTTHNAREASPAFVQRVLRAFGAQRIAWGSNHPASDGTLKALLDAARSLIPEDARSWIFARTAKVLY